eukprot:Filipodium_phascolosomae@DN6737_c0_g1_i1.p1
MTRLQVTEIVLSPECYSVVMWLDGLLMGGCTLRPFWDQQFADVILLGTQCSAQRGGYGTCLMNHVKDWGVQKGTQLCGKPLHWLLTNADNCSKGFFLAQGFVSPVALPAIQWSPFVKEYAGATMMSCWLSPDVDYLNLPRQIANQFSLVSKKGSNQTDIISTQRKPLSADDTTKSSSIKQLLIDRHPEVRLFCEIVIYLETLSEFDCAKFFLCPVNPALVPTYYYVISKPIDISTMRKKAKYYKSRRHFLQDWNLMIENCMTFNEDEGNPVRKAGLDLDRQAKALLNGMVAETPWEQKHN